jgi:methylmalonyl-CoA mutase cobalamin-binding domain/chain
MDRRLLSAISDLKEREALRIVEEMLASGVDPLHVVEVSRLGMDEVGRRYERHEYYLSGLIMSGEIFNEIVVLLDQAFGYQVAREEDPKVILGAPLGDVHDIGKNVVSSLLRCSGFNVVDLGVSVAPARFVEAAGESGATVVGMSALITAAYESMRETVLCFERAGLRDGVKIMLGGGAITGKVCEYAGADAWGRDASDALKFARIYIGKEMGNV